MLAEGPRQGRSARAMFEYGPPQTRLKGHPLIRHADAQRIKVDFARSSLPQPLESYILDAYGIDLRSCYGTIAVKNPFGKASGQLSLARGQVERDAAGGLGFVVLKTVIACDASGEQMMKEWAIPETRMRVERLRGRSGTEGWNVAWKGRGWFGTFEDYRELFDQALTIAQPFGMVVAPSVKYHLPAPGESFWKRDEYVFTTARLLEVWAKRRGEEPMPLEKDFSPTLAGSSRAAQQATIMEWLRAVPSLIHSAAPGRIRLGLKLFNALFEDDFQIAMLEAAHQLPPGNDHADFLIYANRLFGPEREFEGKAGIAYGGPDLSDRNLAVLERFLSVNAGRRQESAEDTIPSMPLSATGDIHSGKIAVEYLLRGVSSFQMHTLFQLPDSAFSLESGSKTQKALHDLLFHPASGFVGWILHLREQFGLPKGHNVQQMADWCRRKWPVLPDSG